MDLLRAQDGATSPTWADPIAAAPPRGSVEAFIWGPPEPTQPPPAMPSPRFEAAPRLAAAPPLVAAVPPGQSHWRWAVAAGLLLAVLGGASLLLRLVGSEPPRSQAGVAPRPVAQPAAAAEPHSPAAAEPHSLAAAEPHSPATAELSGTAQPAGPIAALRPAALPPSRLGEEPQPAPPRAALPIVVRPEATQRLPPRGIASAPPGPRVIFIEPQPAALADLPQVFGPSTR